MRNEDVSMLEDEAKEILKLIVSATKYCHNLDIVHSDLNPRITSEVQRVM